MCNKEVKRSCFHAIFQNLGFYLLFQSLFNFLFGGLDRKIKMLFSPYLSNAQWVLDLGCATGEYTLSVKGKCVGIDLNHEYLKYADKHKESENIFFIDMAAHLLGFKSSSFNVAYCSRFFHHISDSDVLEILKELKRVVVKSGLVVIFDIIDPEKNKFLIHKLIHTDRGKYVRTFDQCASLFYSVLGAPIENRIVYFKRNPFPYGFWTYKVE